MLLGQKKDQEREKNWCVVLKSLENEIDKRRVAQKISDVFSISLEEALDLAASTPIILLDNLPRPAASRIRDYFQALGAEMALSNDVLFKRKCYRTVWPQAPKLSFLEEWSGENSLRPVEASQEVLDPEDALNEVRSLVREKWTGAPTPPPLFSAPVLQEKKSFEAAEPAEVPFPLPSPGTEIKKTQELQALLRDAEERYDALKEEYREARQVFEEKISLVQKENQEIYQKTEELKGSYRTLEERQERLRVERDEKETVFDQLQKEKEEEIAQLKAQCRELESAFEELRGLSQEIPPPKEEAAQAGEGNPRPSEAQTALSPREGSVQWTRLENHLLTLEILQMKQHELLKNMFDWMTQKEKSPVREAGDPEKTEAVPRGETPSALHLKEIEGRLGERQSVLKHLVEQQNMIEKEIRDREDSMRRILSDQETIEREILEAKQVRHRMERPQPVPPS